MRFKVDGKELSAEGMRVGEICEAEKYLNVDMDSGTGAKIAVALYVAMRRDDRVTKPHLLADHVMRVDMTTVEDGEGEEGEGDAGPPAETVEEPEEGNGSGDPESLKSSGLLPSATT